MQTPQLLSPTLLSEIQQLETSFDQISPERRDQLDQITVAMKDYYFKESRADIIVICTHNSRRSHMGQLWIQAGALYYGLSNMKSYSGGTEATAFNHHAVQAMKEVGFPLYVTQKGNNPIYQVEGWEDSFPPLFSKAFSDGANPPSAFIAIMVCDHADEACPFVSGADLRFSLPFDDPKASDGTGKEQEVYLAKAREIGREMLYMLSKIK